MNENTFRKLLLILGLIAFFAIIYLRYDACMQVFHNGVYCALR